MATTGDSDAMAGIGAAEVGTRARAPSLRWWVITPTLLLIWVVGMVDKVGVGLIAANHTFLTDMGLVGRPSLVGLLVTVLLFTYGLAFPLWGFLVDRFGPKKCAIAGLVGWVVASVLAAVSVSIVMLLISRAILGVAEAFLWPVCNALTARWFPLSERGRAKAVWINGINLGLAISGFVVLSLLPLVAWRGVFFVLAGFAAIVCLPLAVLLLRDDPSKDQRMSDPEVALIHSDQLQVSATGKRADNLRTVRYWLATLAWVATTMGVFGFATWLPTYLKNVEHLGSLATSDYIALAFGLCLVVTPLVGIRTDRTRKKALWELIGFLVGAAFLLITRTSPAVAIGVLGVTGSIIAIEGITTLAGQGVLHSFAATGRMGRENGIMVGVGNVVAAFGPTIMGALIGLGGFPAAFAFLAGVFVIGALASMSLHLQGY